MSKENILKARINKELNLKRIANGRYESPDGLVVIQRHVSQRTNRPDDIVWAVVVDGQSDGFCENNLNDAKERAYNLVQKLKETQSYKLKCQLISAISIHVAEYIEAKDKAHGETYWKRFASVKSAVEDFGSYLVTAVHEDGTELEDEPKKVEPIETKPETGGDPYWRIWYASKLGVNFATLVQAPTAAHAKVYWQRLQELDSGKTFVRVEPISQGVTNVNDNWGQRSVEESGPSGNDAAS